MINAYAVSEPGGKLEPFCYDPGPLLPHQVEIAVEHCGICHSDLSMVNDDWGVSQYPLVPGHEVVGTVAAVGDRVTHLKPAQKVGLGWHSGYCMICHQCMSGDHNLCGSADAVVVGRHGGFADRVRADAASVFVLPEGMDPVSAGPLFCGGITVFNPLMQFGISPTAKAGVVGIGGLGHLALQFLNVWGCEVTAFTSSEPKKAELRSLGAHHVVNSRNKDELKAAAGSFDFILSTVNVKLDWNRYLLALRPRGRLHFVGATLEPLDVNISLLMDGQRCVSGSMVGSPEIISTMLAFAVRHNIKPVVEQFRFDQVNEAMAHLQSGRARYRVVLSHQQGKC